MAETTKTLKTRIQLKYDTLANWNAVADTFVPNKGEVCFVEIPTGDATATTAPTVLFKVGDGTKTWGALKWASALAADVYGWAKAASPKAIIDEARSGLIGADSVVKSLNGLKGTLTIEGDDRITFTAAGSKITASFKFTEADKVVLDSGITAAKVEKYEAYDGQIKAKYTKPTGGIPKTDLDATVQASLKKADAALQTHQAVTLESGTNKGTLKLTVNGTAKDNIAVTGLGSAAYTDSGAYATSAQGDKADKALPKADFTAFEKTNSEAIKAAKQAGVNASNELTAYKGTNDAAVQKNANDISALQESLKSGVTFKGKVTGSSLPAASGYKNGDLIIFGDKEYICYNNGTANSWIELGDEGSHLTKTEANNTYVKKNTAITGATKCKITYDSKGLVTKGENLAASDIPSLDAAKITSGTLPDDRIASADTWNAKQNALSAAQLAAVNSGITADKLKACEGKQDALNTTQLSAVNSGITSDLVKKYSGYETAINGKQATLNTTQLSAVNSGITSALVTKYNGYDSKITTLQGKPGLDKVGTVTAAGTGLAISGANNSTVGFDDNCTFIFDCGGAPKA